MHEYITMYVSAFIRNTPRDKTTAGWTQCQSLLDTNLLVKRISVVIVPWKFLFNKMIRF